MNKFKRILTVALGGITLLTTISFGKAGIVNAPNGLILREEPSKSGNVIMTVSDKSSVEIIEESGEWYKVKYNEKEGYLYAEYVDVEETETTNQNEENTVQTENTENIENTEPTYPQKHVTEVELEIYTIPSVTAKKYTVVNPNEEITINYELNNWINVTYGNVQGWARKNNINNQVSEVKNDQEETETQQDSNETSTQTEIIEIDNKKGYVDVSNSVNVRAKATTSSEVITTLLRNTEVIITAEEDGFYKIKYNDIEGYISKSLISDKPVQDVTNRSSEERKPETIKPDEDIQKEEIKKEETDKNTEIKDNTTNNLSSSSDVVSFAQKYLGYDYTYGGETPTEGFDCSGFVYYVYNSFGYSMGRTCSAQSKMGTAVSRNELQPGDLIFFNNGSNGSIGHVGIYIGEGQIIHSANKDSGVKKDTINSGYYNKYYYSARRIVK